MRKHVKILLPIAVLVSGAALAAALVRLKPPVERQEAVVPLPLVRVVSVEPGNVHLKVRSQGTVTPGVESVLVAQIGGRVEWVSAQFADGGMFRRGDLLLRLEDDDFRLTVSRAEAEVARAATRVQLEEAEAEQARRDWEDLGSGEPTALTLREPQLAEARAAQQGAEASLEQARLNLSRTRLTAPYDGRIRAKRADVGQFVAPGTPLAEVFSTEYAEIRLPVAKSDLDFLDFDLSSSDGVSSDDHGDARVASVALTGDLGGERRGWEARIVRAGGEIDPRTRMLPLFARIDDPFARDGDAGRTTGALPMGLYVEARIDGRTVENAAVLPRSALREDGQILVVDEEARLRYRQVEILRVEGDEVIVQAGLESGELVCVSPLETVVDGMSVRIVREDAAEDESAEDEQELL